MDSQPVKHRKNILTILYARWDRLTQPLVDIADFETRIKSRWMASLLAILMPLGIVIGLLPSMIPPLTPDRAFWSRPGFFLPVGLAILITPLYFLSRYGRYKLAAAIVIILGTISIALGTIFDPLRQDMLFDAALFVLPILLATTMLSRREAYIVSAVMCLLVILVPTLVIGIEFRRVLSRSFNLVFVGMVLSLLGAWLHHLISKHQIEALSRANAALQDEIRERIHAEQKTREMAIEQEKSRILKNFIGDISHDLLTPITVIRTSTYVTQQSIKRAGTAVTGGDLQALPQLGASMREHVNRVEESALRLQSLINRLIEMIQTDEQIEFKHVACNLNELVARLVVEYLPHAETKRLRLCFEPDKALPMLILDPMEIARALENLISNAITFTHTTQDKTGVIIVRTRIEGANAVLEVQDNGIGIPVAALPHIFERFYRVDSARATHSGGSGLGLAIVQKIVTAHDGYVEVSSTVGVGSVFRVLLPLP